MGVLLWWVCVWLPGVGSGWGGCAAGWRGMSPRLGLMSVVVWLASVLVAVSGRAPVAGAPGGLGMVAGLRDGVAVSASSVLPGGGPRGSAVCDALGGGVEHGPPMGLRAVLRSVCADVPPVVGWSSGGVPPVVAYSGERGGRDVAVAAAASRDGSGLEVVPGQPGASGTMPWWADGGVPPAVGLEGEAEVPVVACPGGCVSRDVAVAATVSRDVVWGQQLSDVMFVAALRVFGPGAGRFYPVWKVRGAAACVDAEVLGSFFARLVCAPARATWGVVLVVRLVGAMVGVLWWVALMCMLRVMAWVVAVSFLLFGVVYWVMSSVVWWLALGVVVLVCVCADVAVATREVRPMVRWRRGRWVSREGVAVLLLLGCLVPMGAAAPVPAVQPAVAPPMARVAAGAALGAVTVGAVVGGERARLCAAIGVPAQGDLGRYWDVMVRARKADLAQLLTVEGFVGPRGGSPKSRSRSHLARLLTDYRRSREQACQAKRRVADGASEAVAPDPVRPRVDAAVAPGPTPELPEGLPPDRGEPPVRLHPACVAVRPNAGGGHCLYHALRQATAERGTPGVGVSSMRGQLASWLSAHLESAVTPGGGATFRSTIEGIVEDGGAASVEDYVLALRRGVDSRGQVVYGGVVEVAAFAALHPEYVVRVWAGPDDVLAAGSQQYTLVSQHGSGSSGVDLVLTQSHSRSSCHYELMDVDRGGGGCGGAAGDGGGRQGGGDCVSGAGGTGSDTESLSDDGGAGGGDGGSDAGSLGGGSAAGSVEEGNAPDPSICGSGLDTASDDGEPSDASGQAGGSLRDRGSRRRRRKTRGRVHEVPHDADTHEGAPERGQYQQGQGQPRPAHSPAHTGFSRQNRRAAGMAWVRRVMMAAEWLQPPPESLMDYVPAGARPFYVSQWTEMVEWLEKYPNDVERWFLVLRAWPALVMAPLKRGGGSATDQLMRRLERWRDCDYEGLYNDALAERCAREARRGGVSARAKSGGDAEEAVFERVSAEARDGYLSRAAALLAATPLAIADEATWRGLVSRCPPLEGVRRWLHVGRDVPPIHITSKALKDAARGMRRAAAIYTQPHHIRAVANVEGGVAAMRPLCERLVNGDLPPVAVRWLTCQKVVPLSKMSHHQADIEARVAAAADGRGDSYEAPVRPIVVGDALLRVAEKAVCIDNAKVFAAHLMPYQVGVAVPGGMGMWTTVVECLLQVDSANVLLAVDLENMFNAVDRDALVDELRKHSRLAPLARYVVGLYPPGMVSVARIEGEWRRLNVERGLAQGRCLSPVLASVLLQPCIVAAEDAMVAAAGVSREEFCRTCGVAAYLDDLSIVAPPRVAAVGLRAFQRAVARRGWRVNCDKTVCGVGYYAAAADRPALLQVARSAFDGLLPAEMVQAGGQVLLGSPLGPDTADVHVGTDEYRVGKLKAMVDAHDDRLRSVVRLSRRSGTRHSSTQRISVQLAQLLLRWCCNTRDVHLLRAMPRRLVQEVADLHDQAVKVACAATLGMVDVQALRDAEHLHSVPDAALSPQFVRAYAQVRLDLGAGGHGLRAWARHADAAFVGQWALTVQSAARPERMGGGSHYPILDVVVAAASQHDGGGSASMPIVRDLASAWRRCCATTERAVHLGLSSRNARVDRLNDWLLATDGCVSNIARMPEHAQRELSASVVALDVYAFEFSLRSDTHWDASRRLVSWMAHQGPMSGRWAAVVPWDRQGHNNLTNTAYVLSFCRRYRIERPKRLRGPRAPPGGVARRVFDGDYDEADCPERAWQRTMAHNTIVDALCRFLKDCGMEGVGSELKYWDPARVGKDGSRRVPDVVCTHPRTGVEYVLDARIYWNTMSEGPTGYAAYSHTGWGAEHGESDKWTSWDKAIRRRDELSAGGVEFVPFSIEAGGVWGPAARKFFRECIALADDDRDIDLYHWSSTRFSRAWFDSLSVLVARGRAKVSAAAAASDWPKRIRDMQYLDVEDSD